MNPQAADWIRDVVLAQPMEKAWGANWQHLTRLCPCQYSACGNCADLGWHHKCTTRVGHRGSRLGFPIARLAGVPVWMSGRQCAWVCPCPACLAADRVAGLKLPHMKGHTQQPSLLDLLEV